jgi:death on curing protein
MFYWLTMREGLAIHDLQLAQHGGTHGLRDEGLLAAALAHAQNIAAYAEETPSLAVLAAAYGAGIVRNQPFVDGNNRTGLMAAFVFVERNGGKVIATQPEAYLVFHEIAAGKLTEDALARWLEVNTEPASS